MKIDEEDIAEYKETVRAVEEIIPVLEKLSQHSVMIICETIISAHWEHLSPEQLDKNIDAFDNRIRAHIKHVKKFNADRTANA